MIWDGARNHDGDDAPGVLADLACATIVVAVAAGIAEVVTMVLLNERVLAFVGVGP